MSEKHTPGPIMCGGCGETDSSKRCMGCLHDFGTPESAWVRRYKPGWDEDGMCNDNGRFLCADCALPCALSPTSETAA